LLTASGVGCGGSHGIPGAGSIAYERGGDISVANLDGSRSKVIASDADHGDAEPRWSPDGTRVLFFGPKHRSLWVAAVSGTHVRRLPVPPSAADPIWFPDGTRIALRLSDSGCPHGAPRIAIVDLMSGHVSIRKVEQSRSNLDYATPVGWARDGRLVYHFDRLVPCDAHLGDRQSLYSIDMSGGAPRLLVANEVGELGDGVVVPGEVLSPSRKQIAYAPVCDSQFGCDIRVVDMDGRNDHVAARAAMSVNATLTASAASFAWLKPSQFYTVDRAGLHAVGLGGRRGALLARRPFHGDPAFQTFLVGWSSDGSRVAITTEATWPVFVIVSTSTRATRTLHTPTKDAALYLP
jgi:Tol biopolymer transport system component